MEFGARCNTELSLRREKVRYKRTAGEGFKEEWEAEGIKREIEDIMCRSNMILGSVWCPTCMTAS